MSKDFHLDYETYSPLDIKDVGAFRYAEHPQCEITLCCIAKGDDEPLLWDRYDPFGSMWAEDLIEEMVFGDGLIYAHNSQFETAVSRYRFKATFGFDPPALDRWRCTASMARRASIPWSLAECGAFLNLDIQKNAIGKQLIAIFCCPQTRGKRKGERILPTDDVMVTLDGKKVHVSEAWKLFRAYCIDDVKTERGIHRSLSAFELKGDVLEGFLLDVEMNHEGVPVNIPSVEWAIGLSEEAAEIEGTRFAELTGLKPSQREKVLDWLNERGYDRDNLQEATITNRLENTDGMTPEATEALGIRSRVSFAAVSKLSSMAEIACEDHKVRGAFMWAGALRTHRWAGRLIQPQNFRRPTIKGTHEAYETICSGIDLEGLEFLCGNPLEAIASCIRHFIHSPGNQFFDVDFSNIEARITPWLAGQDDLLQAFRDGRDPYIEMGAFIFSVEEKDVTKDQRFVGKQAILGAGFQIGWEKYQTMCAGYGVNLSDEVCQAAVSAYREKNDKIVSMWKLMQQAAVNAIENPEEVFEVRGKIKFFMARTLPYEALVMMLPSKHCLFYPLPQVRSQWMFKKNKYETEEQANYAFERAKKAGKLEEGDRVWRTKAISFWGQEPISKKWMRRDTYGGKLLENCLAGDMEVLTESGWKRIDEITDEKVFDGVEFVSHKGLKKTEGVSTISVDGLRITGEHLILTPRGWVESKNVKINESYDHFISCFWAACLENKRPDGAKVWLSNGKAGTSSGWVQTSKMVVPVRVWGDPVTDNIRPHQGCEGLRPQVPPGEQGNPQEIKTPGLLGVEKHDRPVQTADTPSVAQLRGEGDQGLPPMERVPCLLGGHGSDMEKGSHVGTEGQFKGLQPEELRMDHTQSSGQEYPEKCEDTNPLGSDDSLGSRGEIRSEQNHPVLQDQCRGEREGVVRCPEYKEPVYDILNCGPRNRFVVRGPNKRPVIVHNCVQAVAGDFMSIGARAAQKAGYRIFMLVHDQALAYFEPDKGQSVEEFERLICTLPKWAGDFPLKAECDLVPFYTKV